MKPEKDIDMDDLLIKYLAGEANQAERTKAELWINTSDTNTKYFEHFKLIWEESKKLAHQSTVNENAAWERFRSRIQTEYHTAPKASRSLLWLKVAAILVVVAGLGLLGPWFIKNNDNSRTAISSSPGVPLSGVTMVRKSTVNKVEKDSLPDGSVVTLNKYSYLSFAPSYTGNKRYAILSGEGFFNIKHDISKPFIIETNDLIITVLGTSFNVKSRGDTTEVIVEAGMVSVKKQRQIVRLIAGEKVTSLKTYDQLVKSVNNSNTYRSYFDTSVVAHPPKAQPLNSNTASTKFAPKLDFKKHPELLKKILNNHDILKNYRATNNDIKIRRAVIKSVIADIQKEKLLGADTVRNFRLNENELIINNLRQPAAVFQKFKAKYLREPGYTIYLGKTPDGGKGIFLSIDSL